jgi:hypothetical protein
VIEKSWIVSRRRRGEIITVLEGFSKGGLTSTARKGKAVEKIN